MNKKEVVDSKKRDRSISIHKYRHRKNDRERERRTSILRYSHKEKDREREREKDRMDCYKKIAKMGNLLVVGPPKFRSK